jgi:hypothetical protein
VTKRTKQTDSKKIFQKTTKKISHQRRKISDQANNQKKVTFPNSKQNKSQKVQKAKAANVSNNNKTNKNPN